MLLPPNRASHCLSGAVCAVAMENEKARAIVKSVVRVFPDRELPGFPGDRPRKNPSDRSEDRSREKRDKRDLTLRVIVFVFDMVFGF